MVTHDPKNCWEKPGNEHKKPKWLKSGNSSNKKAKTPTFTSEQVNFLIKNAHIASRKALNKKRKKIRKMTVTLSHQKPITQSQMKTLKLCP